MPWNLSMISLVNAKEAKEVSKKNIVSCYVSLVLPDQSSEVVGFAEGGSFTDVKALDKGL